MTGAFRNRRQTLLPLQPPVNLHFHLAVIEGRFGGGSGG